MKSLDVVIIDDEKKSRDTLKRVLEEFCQDVKVVGVANSVRTGLNIINDVHPDVVFLDIVLNGENGFELLEEISNQKFDIILVSAHSSFALKAIKFEVLDFLIKPVLVEELKVALEKSRARRRDSETSNSQNLKNETIALATSEGYLFAEIDSISHCEADGSYTHFHFKSSKKQTVCRPLKDFENQLRNFSFFRLHNSYLINLKEVQHYIRGEGGYVRMKSGIELPVSREKKAELLRQLRAI